MAKQEAQPSVQGPPVAGRWSRLRALLRLPAWMKSPEVRLAFAVLLAVSVPVPLTAFVLWLRQPAPAPPPPPDLPAALAALERGAWDRATQIVEHARRVPDLTMEQRLLSDYLLAAILHRRADETESAQGAHDLRLMSAELLQQVRRRGWPQERRTAAQTLLAQVLLELGRVPECLDVLQEPLNEPVPAALAPLRNWTFAQACALSRPARPEEALPALEAYLESAHLTAAQRSAARFLEGRLLIEVGRGDNLGPVLTDLAKLPEGDWRVCWLEAYRDLRAQAALLTDRAEDLERRSELLAAANAALARRLPPRDFNAPGTAELLFLQAQVQHALGLRQEPCDLLTQVAELYSLDDAGRAAALQRGCWLLQWKPTEDSLRELGAALRKLPPPEQYANRTLPLDPLYAQLAEIHHELLTGENFQLALQLAGELAGLFGEQSAIQLSAESLRRWGQALELAASRTTPLAARNLQREAQGRYRRAGRLYQELARLRFAQRDYSELVWQGANLIYAGRAYTAAVQAFRHYLGLDILQHRGEAWVGLGDSLLATGQVAEAVVALDACLLEHASDPAAGMARLLAAQAARQTGDLPRAERLLRENLNSPLLSPLSREWRQALLALGELLYEQQRYAEALASVEEAVERYPDTALEKDARYLAIDCCRRLAQTRRTAAGELATRTARAAELAASDELLEAALAHADHLAQSLSAMQMRNELDEAQVAMLRNVWFLRASLLVDLTRYAEAAEALIDLVQRSEGEPECLGAYVQLAGCYRRLGRLDEARTVVAQAKAALERLPADESLVPTTSFDRPQWQTLLDELQAL